MDLVRFLSEFSEQINLTLIILTGALLMARILPLIILSPFLGEESVPAQIKISTAFLLTFVIFPGAEPRMQYVPVYAVPFIALLLKELFIGVALAFVVSMIFEATIAAGTLIDLVSGSSQATMFLPELNLQVSLYANLKTQLTVTLFLTLNGHHEIIKGLAESITIIPLDRFPEFTNGAWPFFEVMLRSWAQIFHVSLALASPAVLATVMVDLGLGAINRIAPGLGVYFIALSIKPLATALVVLLAMHMMFERMFKDFAWMIQMFREAIRLLV